MEGGDDAVSDDYVVEGFQLPGGGERQSVLAGEKETCPEAEEDHKHLDVVLHEFFVDLGGVLKRSSGV